MDEFLIKFQKLEIELNRLKNELNQIQTCNSNSNVKKIIQFSFPELTYKCSLNNNSTGRKKYGTIEQLLSTNSGINSTVGLQDGSNVELPDVRKSVKYNSIVEFSNIDPEIVESHLLQLVDNDKAYWATKHKYEIIEYSKGGFFKPHMDKQIKKTHYGTLLIFPPAVGELAHSGGRLIMDNGKFIFDSSKNTEWTFIAFHTNVLHECTEILSGKRVVFKTELYATKPIYHYSKSYPIVDGSLKYINIINNDLESDFESDYCDIGIKEDKPQKSLYKK